MSTSISDTFLHDVNRMFDNHHFLKNDPNHEANREKYVSRAMSLKSVGIDITEITKITGSFFRKFMDISLTTPMHTHEDKIEAISEKYAELREEIYNTFNHNEEELYHHLNRLNEAFEGALKSTYLLKTPVDVGDIKVERYSEEKAAKREQYDKNIYTITDNFIKNLSRHMDTFYENFIHSIQTNDFNTAYQASISLLKNSQTKSFSDISYPDMLHILDITKNIPTEFDEHGNPVKMRYRTVDESYKALLAAEHIPYSVRERIANLLGQHIDPVEESENT